MSNAPKCRKRPTDPISFRPDPVKLQMAKAEDLTLAIKSLEMEDPDSILALVAKWKLKALTLSQAVKAMGPGIGGRIDVAMDTMPRDIRDGMLVSVMASTYLERSMELEALLEKRGFTKEI